MLLRSYEHPQETANHGNGGSAPVGTKNYKSPRCLILNLNPTSFFNKEDSWPSRTAICLGSPCWVWLCSWRCKLGRHTCFQTQIHLQRKWNAFPELWGPGTTPLGTRNYPWLPLLIKVRHWEENRQKGGRSWSNKHQTISGYIIQMASPGTDIE